MWLDAVAGALLVLFTAIGAWRGALASGLALATLVLAYAAAVLGGPLLAPVFAATLELGEVASLALASSGAFGATFLVLAGVGAVLRHRVLPPEGLRDRFLGGVFGAVRGAGVVLLLGWLALWLEAARAHGAAPFVPELGDSAAAALTSEVVESAALAGLGDDPGARLVARLASRPATALAELGEVVDNRRFAALRGDAMFWTYVESGNVDAALARKSFLDLQGDAQLRHQLAELGLVPEAAATDSAAFRAAVDDVMRQLGPRLRAVRSDPALQELMEDPDVLARLQQGDTLGLLRDPRFRSVVDRALAEPDGS